MTVVSFHAPPRQTIPSFDRCAACIVGAHQRCIAKVGGHCECTCAGQAAA